MSAVRPVHKRWSLLAWLLAAVLLAAGYWLSGRAWILPAVVAAWLAGAAFRKKAWLPGAGLAAFTTAAAAGALLQAPAGLMVAAAAASLAGRELADRENLEAHLPDEARRIPFARAHARLLGASAGLGLLAAEAGLLVQVHLPFAVLALAALAVLFAFYRLFRLAG